jgi:hypothetical protein
VRAFAEEVEVVSGQGGPGGGHGGHGSDFPLSPHNLNAT